MFALISVLIVIAPSLRYGRDSIIKDRDLRRAGMDGDRRHRCAMAEQRRVIDVEHEAIDVGDDLAVLSSDPSAGSAGAARHARAAALFCRGTTR